LIQENDDKDVNTTYCSLATAPGLAAGTYFVRTSASPLLSSATGSRFGYKLNITVN
jgi:hypothetical protein